MTDPSDKPDLSKRGAESPSGGAETPTGAPQYGNPGAETPSPGDYSQGHYPPSYSPQPGGYQPQPTGYPPQPSGYAPQAGYPQPGYGMGYGAPAPTKKNGLGTAALVVAIAALFLFWTIFGGFILGIVAIILGIIGISRAKRGEADNRGIALGGVILGVLAIIASAVFIVIGFMFLWNSTGFDDYYDCVAQANNDQQEIEQCASDWATTLESQFETTIDRPTP